MTVSSKGGEARCRRPSPSHLQPPLPPGAPTAAAPASGGGGDGDERGGPEERWENAKAGPCLSFGAPRQPLKVGRGGVVPILPSTDARPRPTPLPERSPGCLFVSLSAIPLRISLSPPQHPPPGPSRPEFRQEKQEAEELSVSR